MDTDIVKICSIISLAILLIAFIIAFIRLIIGPDINDRISALDLITIIVIGFIIVYALLIKNPFYLDVVIILSLVSFMSTVAISYYINNKEK